MRNLLPCLALASVIANAAPAPSSTIAQRSDVVAALAYLKRTEPQTLEEQARLCEIPAPPFEERARAEYYRGKFNEIGLKDVRLDSVGNVLGIRAGRATTPLLVFSAHLDTVFPPGTDTKVTRNGTILKAPGIADDCRGLAIVLAVARALNEAKIATQGTVVFVGTVGEEGLGDLRGVRHLFDQELAGRITHFISIDGTGLGVATGAVGSYRYRVTFRGAGGHSYGAFGLVNPIHALGRAVEKFGRFEVPADPKTTFNVGRIEGGTSVNSIPHTAAMEVDMRSVDAGELEKLDVKFRTVIETAVAEENEFWNKHARNPIVRTTNRGTPLTAQIERVGFRPTGKVAENSPILHAVRRANAALQIESSFDASSTDSNLPISRGIPAVTLRGGGSSTGNHALQEQFDSKDSHRGTQRALLALLEIVGLAN